MKVEDVKVEGDAGNTNTGNTNTGDTATGNFNTGNRNSFALFKLVMWSEMSAGELSLICLYICECRKSATTPSIEHK